MASGSYLEIVDSKNEPVAGESEGSDVRGAHRYQRLGLGCDRQFVQEHRHFQRQHVQGAVRGWVPGIGRRRRGRRSRRRLITFTKSVDSASTRLMTAMSTAEKLKEATFTVREELVKPARVHDREAFRLHVRLENVTVVSYKLTGRSAGAPRRPRRDVGTGLREDRLPLRNRTHAGRLRAPSGIGQARERKGSARSCPVAEEVQRTRGQDRQGGQRQGRVRRRWRPGTRDEHSQLSGRQQARGQYQCRVPVRVSLRELRAHMEESSGDRVPSRLGFAGLIPQSSQKVHRRQGRQLRMTNALADMGSDGGLGEPGSALSRSPSSLPSSAFHRVPCSCGKAVCEECWDPRAEKCFEVRRPPVNDRRQVSDGRAERRRRLLEAGDP